MVTCRVFQWVNAKKHPGNPNIYMKKALEHVPPNRCQSSQTITLTHWGRMMHIYVSKLTLIDSVNALLPDRHQAIIWTNAGILLIGLLGKNFSEILIRIHMFSFKKMSLKMLFAKWQPFCLGLNVLTSNKYKSLWIIGQLCYYWCIRVRNSIRYTGWKMQQISEFINSLELSLHLL